MQLTPNFSLMDLTRSSTAARQGLINQPDAAAISELQRLCANVLEPLFAFTKGGFAISSGFRSVSVNRAVGGSPTSQHVKGQAADLIPVSPMTVQKLFEIVATSNLPYDQLIFEGTWLHVSTRANPRRQLIKAIFGGKKTTYRALSMPAGPKLDLVNQKPRSIPPVAKNLVSGAAEGDTMTIPDFDLAGLLMKQAGSINLAKITGIVTTIVTGAMSAFSGKMAIALFAVFGLVCIYGYWRFEKSKRKIFEAGGIVPMSDAIESIDTSLIVAEGAEVSPDRLE